jgi:hypothetical protein
MLSINLAAQAEIIQGVLLNDEDPYFVKAGGVVYKVEWYGGSSLFSEGDDVILTTDFGFGKMISDAFNETADVWVEQIDGSPAISSETIRKAITKPEFVAPAPSVSTATQHRRLARLRRPISKV